MEQSMSRADDPYDNAFMESYFSLFKAELIEDDSLLITWKMPKQRYLSTSKCITTPNANIQL